MGRSSRPAARIRLLAVSSVLPDFDVAKDRCYSCGDDDSGLQRRYKWRKRRCSDSKYTKFEHKMRYYIIFLINFIDLINIMDENFRI